MIALIIANKWTYFSLALSDAVHNAYLFEPLEEQSILPRISLLVHHIQLKTIEILHKQALCLERYLSLKN